MSIHDIRRKIDDIDCSIISLVAERMQQASLVKLLKKPGEVEDKEREDELKDKWIAEAQKRGINAEFAMNLLDVLVAESKRLQSL